MNLGDDADTTGAIYGQLAGAFYGVDAIPRNWIERLALRELRRACGRFGQIVAISATASTHLPGLRYEVLRYWR